MYQSYSLFFFTEGVVVRVSAVQQPTKHGGPPTMGPWLALLGNLVPSRTPKGPNTHDFYGTEQSSDGEAIGE